MGRDNPHARMVDMLTGFDLLGPLAQAVIRESPLDLHVGQMLGAAPLSCMDPNTGNWVDAALAAWMRDQIRRKMGQPPDAFRLVPRRVLLGSRALR